MRPPNCLRKALHTRRLDVDGCSSDRRWVGCFWSGFDCQFGTSPQRSWQDLRCVVSSKHLKTETADFCHNDHSEWSHIPRLNDQVFKGIDIDTLLDSLQHSESTLKEEWTMPQRVNHHQSGIAFLFAGLCPKDQRCRRDCFSPRPPFESKNVFLMCIIFLSSLFLKTPKIPNWKHPSWKALFEQTSKLKTPHSVLTKAWRQKQRPKIQARKRRPKQKQRRR